MGIDSESDRGANLVIGPTSLGMVRIYIEAEGLELPLDFDPDAAREIAAELVAAADRAEGAAGPADGGKPRKKPRKKRARGGSGGGG